jgi:peptidoglycan/LPS O-acetylase OafA/YrhL
VYIFAFPVQQLVVYWSKFGPWPFSVCLGTSLFLTLGLAYLSWHWVEKPALRFKPTAKGQQ